MAKTSPESLVYYLDANLDGPDITARLRAGGMRHQRHRDHFASDAEDEVWIPQIAERGWVIVTRDVAIKRRPFERAAWQAAGAILLMIRGAKLNAEALANLLLEAYAAGRLDAYILKRVPPMIIHLQADGTLSLAEGGERRGGKRKT
jgi:hypothetical protein